MLKESKREREREDEERVLSGRLEREKQKPAHEDTGFHGGFLREKNVQLSLL